MTELLSLYADENLKKKLTDFAFPRVDVGTEHKIEFYIYNHSKKWDMEIHPLFDIKTVTETVDYDSLPEKLKPLEKRKIVITWKPSMDIDDPLAGWAGIKGRLLIG